MPSIQHWEQEFIPRISKSTRLEQAMAMLIVCSVCFRSLGTSGGVVLSCGDFQCESCAQQQKGKITHCLACGKQGVRMAPLSSQLPEEVRQNISDPTQSFESVYNVICFQLKYYKQIIKRLQSKLEHVQTENKDLQKKLAETQRPARQLVPSGGTFFQQSGVEEGSFEQSPSPYNQGNHRPMLGLGGGGGRSNQHHTMQGSFGDVRPTSAESNKSLGFNPASKSRESIRSNDSLIQDGRSVVSDHSQVSSRSTNTSRHFENEVNMDTRNIIPRIRSPHSPIVRSPLMQLNSLPSRSSSLAGSLDNRTSKVVPPPKTSTPIQSFVLRNFK